MSEEIPQIPLASKPLVMFITCDHCQGDIELNRPYSMEKLKVKGPAQHLLKYKCPNCGQGVKLYTTMIFERYEEPQVLDFNEPFKQKQKERRKFKWPFW